MKTSGGCSAPPNRDSPELIGRTIFKLPGPPKMGAPTTADLTVIHPNDTGFELNNVTVMYIPSYFVRTIAVRSKPKRRGYTSGRTRTWKKAIVQVGEGDTIPIFQGLEADL